MTNEERIKWALDKRRAVSEILIETAQREIEVVDKWGALSIADQIAHYVYVLQQRARIAAIATQSPPGIDDDNLLAQGNTPPHQT